MNSCICLLTGGLISHGTQDKAKGSGDLVAKQLMLIEKFLQQCGLICSLTFSMPPPEDMGISHSLG